MFDLFYTLFKYKEKRQKDKLGYYPEKVDVRAFPERRFLWTSRFLVILSCLSMCINMMLAGILCVLLPMKKLGIMPLQIDYQLYQVRKMEPSEKRIYAGDLVTESLMAKYVTDRYTINNDKPEDFEELKQRTGKNDFVFLASDGLVYDLFEINELPYFELLQKRGVKREVVIDRVYPVSFDFWQVRFHTIDEAPEMPMEDFIELLGLNPETIEKIPEDGTPIVNRWISTIRMNFNFDKYKEDKDLGLKNPFGLTIVGYDISYMGNNLKSKRN